MAGNQLTEQPAQVCTTSLAKRIGEELLRRGDWIAVAESLTGGMLSSTLSEAPQASQWFRGGVVAYSAAVKRDVLGVRPGPVVSEGAAVDMAQGVALALGAAIGAGVTGVGGPGPQDGQPAGTVWVAVHQGRATAAQLVRLEGEPQEILRQACQATLLAVARTLHIEVPEP